MGALDQILHVPYAYVWLPGLVFVLVVGAVFWLARPAPQLTGPKLESDSTLKNPVLAVNPVQKRTTTRRQGNPVEVHVAYSEHKKDPGIGSVLDRSMGGMRLAIYAEVAVGSVIVVRPVRADDMVPWVELEVRSCALSSEMPGQHEVGCKYVKAPPYSIQLLFG